jgi:diadenylate cyclase
MNEPTIINPFPTITFGEIIDIIVLAILLYTSIVWTQRTRAAFVVRGIVILGIVYIIARYLDLQMTAWIFQAFFAVFLIMIVVIFQEELRHLFERIAVWSLPSTRASASGSTIVDILLRTVADLAKERSGALIVVAGKDPVERHITGGIQLGGTLSEPLLKSIFDRHSPGHDGAVLVENDRVTRFAVHLPLSKDLGQLAHLGTRHSAALGLAELTDALCVVVSEEHGTFSIAKDGRLRQMENLHQVGEAIETFLKEKFPHAEKRTFSLHLLRRNWIAKILSLSLAIGFWYVFVPGSKTIEVTYNVPVTVENLPPGFELEAIQPPEVTVTFVRPRRAFYLFDARKLRATVDGSLADRGRRTFNLSEQNIRYPKDLTVREIRPTTVRISVKKSSPQR